MQRSRAARAAWAPPLSSLTISVAPDRGSSLPHHHPLDARRGRAASRSRRSPPSPSALAHGLGLPLPHLDSECGSPLYPYATQRTAATGEQGAIGVEAVGAGEQRLAGLPLGHLGLRARPSRLRHVGQVGEDEVERLPVRDRALEEADAIGEAEALGVAAGDFERRGRGVGGGDCAARAARRRPPGRSRRSRCRCRAASPARRSSATSTSSSVSGRGIRTRRSTARSRWRNPLRPTM